VSQTDPAGDFLSGDYTVSFGMWICCRSAPANAPTNQQTQPVSQIGHPTWNNMTSSSHALRDAASANLAFIQTCTDTANANAAMTSLSDSQNIDADSGSTHWDLPSGSPIQACPHCEALIDITEREPLEVIDSPGCGQRFAVTGQISHYQVVEVAGRGGMGVVYKAYDAGLDRYVALKLLKKSQSNDAKLIELLETEAAITAAVNNPNVVRVYGTGRDRGRFFLAMELVENGSLDDLIHLQGRVAEVQVLAVGIQIGRGLNAAHQQGLIHRDVKPGNILFSDAHTAKIVDFGLAITMAQEESVRGEVWGTPYYVAPEKLDRQPEDFRSDTYSLGGTLFHALAGRPPFEAKTASLVALKHLKSQAVRVQAFAPWVSNTTAHIIDRTLSKNPADRYQSYEELIQNLEYALGELQKHGNAQQPRARVVMEIEENQKIWTWVVLGMAAVIVVPLGVFFASGRKTKPVTGTAKTALAEKKPGTLVKGLSLLSERSPTAPEEFQHWKIGAPPSVPNPSFESPDQTGLTPAYTNVAPPGWTFTGSANGGVEEIRDNRFGPIGSEGSRLDGLGGKGDQVGYINLGNSGWANALSDEVGVVAPNTVYTLRVAFSQRNPKADAIQHPAGSFGLSVNGTDVGTFTPLGALAPGFNERVYLWKSPATGDPLVGQTMHIHMAFTYDSAAKGWQQAQFENVRLEAAPAVPSNLNDGKPGQLLKSDRHATPSAIK
jgi:serine/threonine protein kinase